MGVVDQKVNTTLFDEDLKKPGKALMINKKNLFLIGFVVIMLQVADSGILWMMGSNSHSSGDSFVFSAVIFAILKCMYDKCIRSSHKVHKEEKAPTEEEEDCRKSATCVVDTMKVRGPPPSNKTSTKTKKTGARIQKPEQRGCEATIWVASWWRPQCLNPKAKKFTPLRTYHASTLNSNSVPFWPQEIAMKEKELLKSESGGTDAGEVVYRSSRWLTEIGLENKQKDPVPLEAEKTQKPDKKNASKRSKSMEHVKLQKVAMVKRQEPQQRKWVPKSTQPC